MRRLLELRDTRGVFLTDQISCNWGGMEFLGPTAHEVAGMPRSLYVGSIAHMKEHMANMARVTLRREALLHLELIYFRRNRTHCAHIYHSKLTSTRNSRPFQERNLRATVLPPVEHGKSKLERLAMFVQKYSDSPLVPTKLVPAPVTSAQISLHTSVTTSVLLVPAPVTST